MHSCGLKVGVGGPSKPTSIHTRTRRQLCPHPPYPQNQVSLAAVVSGCAGCQPLTNLSFKSNDVCGEWIRERGGLAVPPADNCIWCALPNPQISAEGARWIADLLSVDNLLSCLDLRCNNLGGGCCWVAV